MCDDRKLLNLYRFTSGEKPSDEMLSCIMKEVAEIAAEENRYARERYFQRMIENSEKNKELSRDRINKVVTSSTHSVADTKLAACR